MFNDIEIILIRHGESEGNIDFNVYKEKNDAILNLTNKGVQQAVETGNFLNGYLEKLGWQTARVFSSSYDRATQTANTVLEQINYGLIIDKHKYDDRLRECEFGLVDGMTDDEMTELYPRFGEQVIRDEKSQAKYFTRYPGGESAADVGSRCRDFFGALIRDYKDRGINKFIIVAHGITLRAFQKELLHPGDFRWYSTQRNPKNASVYHIKAKVAVDGLGMPEHEGCVFIPELSK